MRHINYILLNAVFSRYPISLPPYKFQPNHPIFGSTFPLSSLHSEAGPRFGRPVVLFSRMKTASGVLFNAQLHSLPWCC